MLQLVTTTGSLRKPGEVAKTQITRVNKKETNLPGPRQRSACDAKHPVNSSAGKQKARHER